LTDPMYGHMYIIVNGMLAGLALHYLQKRSTGGTITPLKGKGGSERRITSFKM
jgi:hypothetical protein